MKVLVGITVLLAFVAAASASRGASRDLQTMGVDQWYDWLMPSWLNRPAREPKPGPSSDKPKPDKEPSDKPDKGKPMVPPGDKPGKPGMPDPDNNSTCADKWYVDKEETHECVCDQLKKCNITGLQGEEGPPGPDGFSGRNGTDGAQGEPGEDGQNGECTTEDCQDIGGIALCSGDTIIRTSNSSVDQTLCQNIYNSAGAGFQSPPGNFDCVIARCNEGEFLTGGTCTSTGASFVRQAVFFSDEVQTPDVVLADAAVGIACSPANAAGNSETRVIAQIVCCRSLDVDFEIIDVVPFRSVGP